MFGVKLTILGLVLFIVLLFFFRVGVRMMTPEEKVEYMLHKKLPKWLDKLGNIVVALLFLDIIGVIWTVIYILFLR